MISHRLIPLWGAALLVAALPASARHQPDYEQPPLSYSATTPQDAITALQGQIAAQSLSLTGGEQQVLRELLKALHVPVESQLLVFSKTSLQRGLIRPDRPRAIFFSDTVYVGWVPGGVIEVTAIDPQLGPVFYSMEHRRRGAPTIIREPDCLRCHGGTFVRDIPGVFARTVFTSASGEPLLRHGTAVVDDETPFAHRWGGWYVTGYHGREPHRGNSIASESGDQLVFTPSAQRPDELGKFFATDDYPARTSDVVALLVFEHQTTMQNTLTHAGISARKMIAYQHALQEAFQEPKTEEPAYDSVKSVFASAAEAVVDRLLFRNAAPLPDGVVGSTAFRRVYSEGAPRSAAGHSLRDLKLAGHLFVHRCSPLIYTPSFLALPEPLKARIFELLGTALQDRPAPDRYSYIGDEEKRRIRTILLETHPEAARRWTAPD